MTAPPPCLEICVDGVDGALAAVEGGADRVELCGDLANGGTTPSPGALAVTLARCRLPVMVMIRPRAGDFVYSAAERDVMAHDIEAARDAGAAGVVLGLLTGGDEIDVDGTAALVARARPLPVTFHRAFDHAADPLAALDRLLELGVDRLLTSGQAEAAPDGAELLAALVERAAGRIVIMAGGGLREAEVPQLIAATGVREIHASASVPVAPTRRTVTESAPAAAGRDDAAAPARPARPAVPLGPADRGDGRRVTSVERVRRFAAALRARS